MKYNNWPLNIKKPIFVAMPSNAKSSEGFLKNDLKPKSFQIPPANLRKVIAASILAPRREFFYIEAAYTHFHTTNKNTPMKRL